MLYVGKTLFHAPSCCLHFLLVKKSLSNQLKNPQHLRFKYLNWTWFNFKKCQIKKKNNTCSQAFIEIPKLDKEQPLEITSYMFLKLYYVHLNTPHTSIRSLKTQNTFNANCLQRAPSNIWIQHYAENPRFIWLFRHPCHIYPPIHPFPDSITSSIRASEIMQSHKLRRDYLKKKKKVPWLHSLPRGKVVQLIV